MKTNNIMIELKSGHLIHQLDAISEAANLLKRRLTEIPVKYCESCGGELVAISPDAYSKVTVKECAKCKEEYIFPV